MSQASGTDFWSARLRRIRERLHGERLGGLLVSHPPDLRYLSGFTGSSGILLIEPGLATLFTDFRYREQAQAEIGPAISLQIASDGLFECLSRRLDELPAGSRIGFDPATTTVRDRQELDRRCGTAIWDALEGAVAELRAVKDGREIESIEAAVRLAEGALEAVLASIHPGVTEQQVAADLVHALRSAGSGPLPFEPIVASGPRSALPHATPAPREVRSGELLLLDFGARLDGYCSDLTRVCVVGRAQEWQREVHAAVREACRKGVEAAGPGALASEVDGAAREHLASLGLAEYFGHSTGHGIGLEVHEAPRLHWRESSPLEAGNVVTVEPGVYLPGRGGIRIEQDVVIEAGGRRVLGGATTDLMEI